MELADKNFFELYIKSFNIISSNKIVTINSATTNEILYMSKKFFELYKGKYTLGKKFGNPTTVIQNCIVIKKEIISPLTGITLGIEHEYKSKSEEPQARHSKILANKYSPLIWSGNRDILTSNTTTTDTLYYIKLIGNNFVLFMENVKTEEISEVELFTESNAVQLVAEIDNFANFLKDCAINKILLLESIKFLNKNDIDYILLYLKTLITVGNYNIAIQFQPISDKLVTNELINPHTGNIIGRFVNLH